jgi:hypothetical protein
MFSASIAIRGLYRQTRFQLGLTREAIVRQNWGKRSDERTISSY